MRLPHVRIRTLMILVAGAAIGFAAAPRTYLREPRVSLGETPPYLVQYSSVEFIATATGIGAGTYAVLIGILALLPRMTTRRWMIAVAVIGVPLGLYCRQQYQEGVAEYHDGLTEMTATPSAEEMQRQRVKADWHAKLADKYREAAESPWRPVEPCPPEPE